MSGSKVSDSRGDPGSSYKKLERGERTLQSAAVSGGDVNDLLVEEHAPSNGLLQLHSVQSDHAFDNRGGGSLAPAHGSEFASEKVLGNTPP